MGIAATWPQHTVRALTPTRPQLTPSGATPRIFECGPRGDGLPATAAGSSHLCPHLDARGQVSGIVLNRSTASLIGSSLDSQYSPLQRTWPLVWAKRR